jgi:hypothetical protein
VPPQDDAKLILTGDSNVVRQSGSRMQDATQSSRIPAAHRVQLGYIIVDGKDGDRHGHPAAICSLFFRPYGLLKRLFVEYTAHCERANQLAHSFLLL